MWIQRVGLGLVSFTDIDQLDKWLMAMASRHYPYNIGTLSNISPGGSRGVNLLS
jgi:hypothetical protein